MKFDLDALASLSQEEIDERNAKRARTSKAITTTVVLLVLSGIAGFFLLQAFG